MTKWPTDNADELKQALIRLMEENARWRRIVEEAEVLMRRRANIDGLSLKSAIKTILDERDKEVDRNQFWRKELKKTLTLLIEDRVSEAKKELNIFLFKNPK